ncbi:MAG: hypothetical protein ATN33_02640 [Epulopiscium sp. Nele67-Bin001]|nr:MAG: hypothetical protein ATN33_02640 [Epulopiscium sp. Nele67-Bin001]
MPPELDQAHRVLVAKPQNRAGPELVIIRLHRYQVKDQIIRVAHKRHGKHQYGESTVHIFEDYTLEVLEQQAKYRDVMPKLYGLGVKPSLLYSARLQITLQNSARKR